MLAIWYNETDANLCYRVESGENEYKRANWFWLETGDGGVTYNIWKLSRKVATYFWLLSQQQAPSV